VIDIHADDFGLTTGVTDGILDAYLSGRLDSVSLVPNGFAFDYAVEKLKEFPELGVSVHLNFFEGRPLADVGKIPLLVDPKGYFNQSFESLWIASLFSNGRRVALQEQVKLEMGLQIDRVKQALNVESVRVDSHRHYHLIPFVFKCLLELVDSHRVKAVRIPFELFSLSESLAHSVRTLLSTNPIKHYLLNALSRYSIPFLNARGIAYNRYFVGVLFTGNMTLSVVENAVSRFERTDSSIPPEVLFHPGAFGNNEREEIGHHLRGSEYYSSSDRTGELDVLTSRAFCEFVDDIRSDVQ